MPEDSARALVLANGRQRPAHPGPEQPRGQKKRPPAHDRHEVVVVALARSGRSAPDPARKAGTPGSPIGPCVRSVQLVATRRITSAKPTVTSTKYAPRSRRVSRPSRYPASPEIALAATKVRSGESAKSQGQQPRGVGADAEEGRVSEIELSGRQEQIHARGQHEEDPGHDQQVEIVIVDAGEGQRENASHRQGGEDAGPHRDMLFFPKSPWGRHSRSRMIMMKPMASL